MSFWPRLRPLARGLGLVWFSRSFTGPLILITLVALTLLAALTYYIVLDIYLEVADDMLADERALVRSLEEGGLLASAKFAEQLAAFPGGNPRRTVVLAQERSDRTTEVLAGDPRILSHLGSLEPGQSDIFVIDRYPVLLKRVDLTTHPDLLRLAPDQISSAYRDVRLGVGDWVLRLDRALTFLGLFLLLIATILACLAAHRAARRAMRNYEREVRRLNRHLARVGEGHLEPAPLPKRPTDKELVALSRNVSKMVIGLRSVLDSYTLFEQVPPHNIVTPLLRARLAISRARRALDDTVPCGIEHNLKAAEDDLSYISEMQHKLLELAKLNAAMVTREQPARVDLTEQARATLSATLRMSPDGADRQRVEVAGRTFTVECHIEDGIEVMSHALICDQLIGNLLQNAIKYAPLNATIAVTLERVGAGRFRLSVANTGGGFPADVRDTAFQPFSRSKEVSADIPGFGLGLSIVERIASIYEWTVEITPSDDVAEVVFGGRTAPRRVETDPPTDRKRHTALHEV